VLNESKNEVVIFAVNRGKEILDFEITFDNIMINSVEEFSQLSGFDIKEINREGQEIVQPTESAAYEIVADDIHCQLQPLSWNMIRCKW
ncbi:alpha-N-arabinofuranosidase 1, partial [Listeria ivanovii FSL F6-596]